MTVSLRPMAGSEVDEFLAGSRENYIAERVQSGEDDTAAARVISTRASDTAS